MTANEISERVAAAEAELDRVHKAACNGSQAWRVSIPVNEQRDSDVLIGNGLSAVKELLAEVERLQTALAAVERERDAAVRERGVAVDTLDGAEGLLWYVMNTINSDAVIYDGWEARRDGNDLTITQREQTARQHDDAAEGSGER